MQRIVPLFAIAAIQGLFGCSCQNRFQNDLWQKMRNVAKIGDNITPAEDAAIKEQQAVLYDIMKLYAEEALERPKDLVACAREMFAMRRSGKCRDRFSQYLAPEEVKWSDAADEGKISGIGIELSPDDANAVIVRVIENGPAEKAGIKVGDIILKIDGKIPKDKQEAVSLIRGKTGTEVALTISRKGAAKPLEFTLVRADILIQSVKSRVSAENPKIGVIKIEIFDRSSAKQFDDAARNLMKNGVTGIIVDLRNNPGGLLWQALGILLDFARYNDTLLTLRRRTNISSISCLPPLCGLFRGLLADANVVVLINGRSASASEIVAGTLKDWGYTLIGQKTFGKGVGQALIPLRDGSRLVLTVFEFSVGNSKTRVHEIGVSPTIEVSPSTDKNDDPEMRKAMEFLGFCVVNAAPPQGKCKR
jgi:carboxyl-terminal processing protease